MRGFRKKGQMNASHRCTKWLKTDWLFTRSDVKDAQATGFDDAGWDKVRVPHDWAIAGPFDRNNDVQLTAILENGETKKRPHTGRTGGLPHVGKAWYRRWLELPSDIKGLRFRLEFDGVMSHSQVYINAKKVGAWPYGYTSFAFDITEHVNAGKNLLAVSIDNPPSSSRWYPGAGIYRHVRLVTLPETHMAYEGVWVTTESVDEKSAKLAVRTEIENHGNSFDDLTLETVVLDPTGREIASAKTAITGAAQQKVHQEISISNPMRWSLDSPNLYSIRSHIKSGTQSLDMSDTRFGIRTLAFDAHAGFQLNGRRVQFQGVCMHHDLGPLGTAVNKSAIRRQLRILKDMGCNAIRTSHNPPAPELLDLTDEMGFLVIDEAFDEWKEPKLENGYFKLFNEWAERDLRALIRRDRNHPSVILWSIGNEIRDLSSTAGHAVARFLHNIAHDEDPTRPTTVAISQNDQAIFSGLAEVVDVPGWNYKPHRYGVYRDRFPNIPMYGSETASCISSRGEYYFPVEEERHLVRDTKQVNSYDLSSPGWANYPDVEFRGLDDTPSMMGEFVWTGFDYLGEPTPYAEAWPSRSSYFGIVDLCGLPKDRFYLYRSRWSREPTLHLLPHWTWPGREGQVTPVHCYTSWKIVDLYLNGRFLGRRSKNALNLQNRYRLVWAGVPYEPGELKAVACDDDGKPVTEYIVRTAEEPAALSLVPEANTFNADGDDMAFVAFHICDSRGVRCPRADHKVMIRITGPAEIAAMDNGNAASVELFAGPSHHAFNGSGMLYLRSRKGESGEVVVEATSDGLKPARITLQAKPVQAVQ